MASLKSGSAGRAVPEGLTPMANRHIASIVLLTILVITAVTLRFLSKRRSSARYGLDDWTILACVFFVVASSVEGLYTVSIRLVGVSFKNFSEDQMRERAKVSTASTRIVSCRPHAHDQSRSFCSRSTRCRISCSA